MNKFETRGYCSLNIKYFHPKISSVFRFFKKSTISKLGLQFRYILNSRIYFPYKLYYFDCTTKLQGFVFIYIKLKKTKE